MKLKSPISRLKMAVIATVCIGLFIIWAIASDFGVKARSDLMSQAKIVANSINIERLKKLRGNESDIASLDYSRIKEQLYNVRISSENCRFLYIVGYDASSGNVFFFVDSQLPNSEDYAPPGLIYEEVIDEFREAVKVGSQKFVGPLTDRWGTLVTALVPLRDPETNQLIATLGMDVEADDWQSQLIQISILPVGLMLLTTFLIILSLVLKLKTNELHQTVMVDSLTKLFSRKTILEQAEIALTKSIQGSEPFSIIVLDIDNFKQVNDKYGHMTGDAVLRDVSSCFIKAIRKTDMAGRIGGEEFIILLPYTNKNNALEIAEKIRTSIESLSFEGESYHGLTTVTASFGVSTSSELTTKFDELYSQADKALYISKNKGKNKVSFSPGGI